jgi:hypothetical protein
MNMLSSRRSLPVISLRYAWTQARRVSMQRARVSRRGDLMETISIALRALHLSSFWPGVQVERFREDE